MTQPSEKGTENNLSNQDGKIDKKKQSKNGFIQFLDHNGMRPIIVLILVFGAIFITSNSKNFCVIQEPPSVSGSETKIILRDNPICSKYFEMAALIIGGILGLTVPGKVTDSLDK